MQIFQKNKEEAYEREVYEDRKICDKAVVKLSALYVDKESFPTSRFHKLGLKYVEHYLAGSTLILKFIQVYGDYHHSGKKSQRINGAFNDVENFIKAMNLKRYEMSVKRYYENHFV